MKIVLQSNWSRKKCWKFISKSLLGASAIIVTAALPQAAFAEDAEDSVEQAELSAATQQSGPIEEVIVSGFRQSLRNAVDAKRVNDNIVDAIKAEDIGKSTDQNIAEALQRVTGVSINRDSGEGTTIVARGAPAELNNVTLNGVALPSGGADGAVNLSQFSADVLSSIEVIKTPSASHDEGSLGAAIVLKGFSPLDAKKNRRVLELQGRKNSLVGSNIADDHKIALSLSNKFRDDTLGVSFVGISETVSTRKDTYAVGPGLRSVNLSRFNGGAINADTGEFITQFDYGDGNGPQDIIALMPQVIQNQLEQIEQERDTFTGTIQFQPNDTTNMKLDVSYAQQDINRLQNEFSLIPDVNNRGAANYPDTTFRFDPTTSFLLRNVHVSEGANNNNRDSTIQFAGLDWQTEQDTVSISGLFEKTIGDFDFTVRGGHSETDLITPKRLFTRFRNTRERRTGNSLGYDCGSPGDLCTFVLPEGYIDDPTNFIYNTGSVADQFGKDYSDSAYFDLVWNKEIGIFKSFESGLKWSRRDKVFNDSSQRFNVNETGNALSSNGYSLADFSTDGNTPANFGSDIGLDRDQVTDGWWSVNGDAVIQQLSDLGVDPVLRLNLRNTRDIVQEVTGGYVQANFESDSGTVFGNVGLRFADTDSRSLGFSGYNYSARPTFITPENIAFFGSEAAAIAALGRSTLEGNPPTFAEPTPTLGSHSYSNVLPSLNVNWAFRDDMMARFAASKTIARPPIDLLRSGFSVTEDVFGAQSRANFGAADLNPYESTNLDVSYEWYFDDGSLFSAALFNKDLKDFAETNSFFSYWRDVRDEFYDVDGNLLPQSQINFVATGDDTLLPLSGGATQPNCMPNREEDLSAAVGELGCDLLLVTRSRNGTGGYVRGLELSLQHNFTNLPGFWSGFGFLTNYTYSDSQAEEETDTDGTVLFAQTPLLQTSEDTFNLTTFYETDEFLLRLAYNYRSEYLINRNTRNGHALWRGAFDSLDLSGSYNLTDKVSLNFQAQNLLDTETEEYITVGQETNGVVPAEAYDFGGIDSRVYRKFNTGKVFRVGIRFNF